MQKVDLIKYSDLRDYCGEPGSKIGIITAPFPFTLYLNGDKRLPCNNFYGNERIYPATYDAFSEILAIFGIDFIRKNGLDEYGGCYMHRPVRGGRDESEHSWAMALDYLPSLGKLGEPSRIPYHIVAAFKNRGFVWGGDYNRTDGMHFSGVCR